MANPTTFVLCVKIKQIYLHMFFSNLPFIENYEWSSNVPVYYSVLGKKSIPN